MYLAFLLYENVPTSPWAHGYTAQTLQTKSQHTAIPDCDSALLFPVAIYVLEGHS